MNEKQLPLNISSFKRIYEANMIYVDKTPLIYKFASVTGQYFLSRPRRFGKSLLVSLLKFLFMGKKEYFKGLWIYDKWNFEPMPVLVFDFNSIGHMTKQELEISLWETLDKHAEKFGISLKQQVLTSRFSELILKLSEKHGKIVVLVDEYDKPLIDHIGLGEERLKIAFENRSILKSFFGVLKDSDVSDVLRFLFLTGVSKFSHISIFSELNNLADLTMDKEYACLLGYTEDEINKYFQPWIDNWIDNGAQNRESSDLEIKDKLRRHYNGFRFTVAKEKVYNPISILNALKNQDYQAYWFETATPTFLANLIMEKNFYLPQIETESLLKESFSTYELDNLAPIALMQQTGYLTFKDINFINDTATFTFDFPNIEVKQAFLNFLMLKYGHPGTYKHLNLAQYLINKEFNRFIQIIQSVFDQVPKTDQQDAYWFHQFFYMVFRSACPESHTINIDRKIVIAWENPNSVFLTGFSCLQNSDDIMKCLHDKQLYKTRDKHIYYLSINFDIKTKKIMQWEQEHYIPEPVYAPVNIAASVKKIRLFLASSKELEHERKEVALWVSRKNKELIEHNKFIDLVVWEELLLSFQETRIQDYFNEQMLSCDIMLALFYTKVGAFTLEEFNLAHESLKAGKNPRYLFAGFKQQKIEIDRIGIDYIEVLRLKEKIKQEEQIYFSFDSADSLILQLDKQLKLITSEKINATYYNDLIKKL
ncbi:MAG: AAA family ATPase [Desulfobacula sp.]|nr:AAA family ATPase [Desulfobacula sp.]